MVALASFRVQSVTRDLDEARASFDEDDVGQAPRFGQLIEGDALDQALGVAPDDVTGAKPGRGVAHQHVAALAHLSIRTPLFAGVAEGERSGFMRDEDGALVRSAMGAFA